MYKPLSFFIGFRYLWNSHLPKFKKIITILSIIGVSISTAALIIIISVINGSEADFKKNILSFIPHLIITNKNKYVNKLEFPKNILKSNNIEKISYVINKEVFIKNKNNINIAEIVGIDHTNYENIKNYNIENVLNLLQKGQYNAIIGKELAKKLNVYIGDKIQLILLSNKKNFFSGKVFNIHQFNIANIFSTKNDVDYYQILINKEDSLSFLNYNKNYITSWRVWLKNPFSLNVNEFKKLTKNLFLLDWKSQISELFNIMQIEKYIMLFLFLLIFLVSIFNIFVTLTTYIIEKKNDIFILQSQGLQKWKIISIFVVLSSSIAIIGNLLGTIISIFLIIQNDFLKFLINIFFNEAEISIVVLPFQIFFINIISIFFIIISTLYPIWSTIKLQTTRIFLNE